jgi:hypothetical protein
MSLESSKAISSSYETPLAEKILLTTTALIISPLLCLVSSVALPILSFISIWNYGRAKYYYYQTLTECNKEKTREPFGRIKGQNYNEVCSYGRIERREVVHVENCAFKTMQDKKWLDNEYIRKEAEELLRSNLKMMRLFAKGLIPFIGALWIVHTEGKADGALLEIFSCDVDPRSQWREAIDSHRNHLTST